MREAMPDPGRILITGCRGFIGGALFTALRESGYDVWGQARQGESRRQILGANLLEPRATKGLVERARPDSIVHAAALAHGQPLPPGQTYSTLNTRMTRHLLEAVGSRKPRLLFLSSVAVYGENRRFGPVAVDAAPRPGTDYAKSKLLCEQAILASNLEHCEVIRLAPVYDEAHMKDVRKRAVLPGPLPLRFSLRPSPSYSLCHVRTVVRRVLELLESAPRGRVLHNLADPEPYDQNELASWFPGLSLLLPVFVLKPFYYLSYLLPRERGYELRCLYWRLLHSNVYPPSCA